jgi:arabinogalactan oligomer/maltooligosaccharide transport system substrate-binding protein
MLLVASITIAPLAGCLRSKPEPVLHLTWWITYAPDSVEYPAFQTIAETYTEQTGTVIDLHSVPWDDIASRGGMATRLALTIESGEGPDLWGPVPHTWVGPYVDQGLVLALEPAQVQDRGQVVDVAVRASRWHGVQYAMPILMDSIALIYNQAMVPEPPQSFEEIFEIAQGLTDAENDRWGLVLPLTSQSHAYPFMDGYGGYIFGCHVTESGDDQCDLGDIGLNNEGAVRGIQLMADLYLKEKLFPEPLADRSVMHEHALNLFTEGQAAMLIDGPWALPEIRASPVQYGVASLPTLPDTSKEPRPLTVVHSLAISADTAYPDQAIDFLNHVSSPESVAALVDALHKAPVRRDVLRAPALSENREVRVWHDQAAYGVLLPNVPEFGYVWAPWARALDEAIPGLKPVPEALDQAVEQIRGYIEPQ